MLTAAETARKKPRYVFSDRNFFNGAYLSLLLFSINFFAIG